jgi:hypothetical protein
MSRSNSVWLCIPRISFVIVLVILCEFSVSSPRPATAQAITPFLTTPYYGNTTTISQWFSSGSHEAIDFTLNYERVLAAASGTISELKWYNTTCHNDPDNAACGYGLYMRIDHAYPHHTYQTLYAHLSAAVNHNYVYAGQVIGTSGHTGYSTGPHLHFEVRHNGVRVDPFNEGGVSLWLHGACTAVQGNRCSGTSLLAPTQVGDITIDDGDAGFSKGYTTPYPYPWSYAAGTGYNNDTYYGSNTTSSTYYRWAKWEPTLSTSSQGTYEVYVHIPSNYATTWQAKYIVDYIHGPTTAFVDQAGLFNQWVSIGTYFLSPADASVEVTNQTDSWDTPRNVAADAVRFVRLAPAYLPDTRASGGWNSSVVVRANGGSAYTRIEYFDASGNPKCAVFNTVPVAGSWESGPSWCTNPSTIRSAIVYASQDVAVVVENEANSHTERTNYTGILPDGSSGSPGWEQTGSTLYAPVIKRQRYGRSSTIHVANAGSQATTVYVYYYNDGGTARWGGSYALGPNGTVTLSPGGGGSGGCNASNTICSARLYSSNGQPLAGVVREYNDADGRAVTTHNLFNAGATWIYFPLVKYERYDMSTGLRIQNVGTAGATVTVNYYQKDGTWKCVRPQYTPRYAARTFYDSSCPGSDFAGNAVASASQPLVGMANEVSITGPQRKKGYSSFQGGSQTAYGSLVYHDFYQNGHTWDTGIAVQNLSTQNASVDLYYYHSNGSPAGSQLNQTINGRGSGVFSPPQSWFKGSVLITATRDIAAVVNVINYASSGDTHAMYNASNR